VLLLHKCVLVPAAERTSQQPLTPVPHSLSKAAAGFRA
jgi:hypothetical protein